MELVVAGALSFCLDLLLGDPGWIPHPVVWMGRAISGLEERLRRIFPKTTRENGPQVLCLRSCCRQGLWHLPFLYCGLLGRFILGFASFWRFSGGGRRWLYGDWGRKVAGFIGRCGRELWSRPSRRWPASWDGTPSGWTGRGSPGRRWRPWRKISDGVAAPLFYFFLGGAPLALCYKAINTMDSMVGYRNERYLYFGRWAARLDDGANWLPARLSALLLVAAAWLLGEDGRGAWRIWRRDRRNHASPNAAQTEAAMAGALGVRRPGQLGILGYGWKNRPLESISARLYQRIFCAVTGCSMGAASFALAF